MTKLELSLYIANTLFGKHLSGDPPVKSNNWKVKELMKKSKTELNELAKLAVACRKGTANSSMLDS